MLLFSRVFINGNYESDNEEKKDHSECHTKEGKAFLTNWNILF